MNPKVDEYLEKSKTWREELAKLRAIILDCHLTEDLKWGKPCYTVQNSNTILIIPLKDHCALMFCKGALLKDASHILTKPGENTQGGRWIKFAGITEIAATETILKAYIQEAVEVEKSGLEIKYKETSEYAVPIEFQNKLNEHPALNTAFDKLTPGRQRAYILNFSAPKQSKTRDSRVEKCMQRILDGKGLND